MDLLLEVKLHIVNIIYIYIYIKEKKGMAREFVFG